MRILVGIVLLVISLGINGAVTFISPAPYSLGAFLFIAALSYYPSDTLENALIMATAFGIILDLLSNNKLFFFTAGLPILLFVVVTLKDYFKISNGTMTALLILTYTLLLFLLTQTSIYFSAFLLGILYLFHLLISSSTRLILLKGRDVKER